MLDLALSEDLATKFRWENKTATWEEAVRESMKHPSMLMGVSDGGAHLDRDDGADWSSYFLRFWVLDREVWTLEEGIRQLTQVPAAMAGFTGRGALLPGLRRGHHDLRSRHRRSGHEAHGGGPSGRRAALLRAAARDSVATIVNGEPIVLDGKLTDRPARPRPAAVRPAT